MWKGILKGVAILIVLVALASGMAGTGYQGAHADHIYPGVSSTDGVGLGALTRKEALALLTQRSEVYSKRELRLRYGRSEWMVSFSALGIRLNAEQVADAAYTIGRQGNALRSLADQFEALRIGRAVDVPVLTLHEQQAAMYIDKLAKEIDRPVIDARLVVDNDFGASILTAQVGRKLNVSESVRLLGQAWASAADNTVDLPVGETPPAVVEANLEPTRTALNKMLAGPLTLKFDNRTWTLSQREIANLLPLVALGNGTPGKSPELDDDGLVRYVRRLKQEIDQGPQKARLAFNAGQVRVVREGRPGYELQADEAVAAIESQIASDNRTVLLPVKVSPPAGMSEDRLAIKELAYSASTSYAGSLAERSFNVELAASKLDGVVVVPGEVFSFNEELGPMTLQAGFKWGWGISQSQGQVVTIPSVAGGICQVSTTLFQAVFWAGYQIEERNWHLYWISRYGQPPTGLKGLDATVDQANDEKGNIVSAIDLKFKNTTPFPILIEAKTDGAKLTFSLYSTKPSWVVKVDPPKIEDVVKADATILREEDPALPPGKEVWIEAAADGFKSTIVRTVLESGKEPRVLRLVSTYKPSRNVLLAGPSRDEQPGPGAEPSPTPSALVPGEQPVESNAQPDQNDR